jgi:formylglycine-generating enzyme required for sulfatase activity
MAKKAHDMSGLQKFSLLLGLLLMAQSGMAAEPTGGRVFHDAMSLGEQGPAMVVVPAGEFLMGDLQGDGYANELPVHSVRMAKPFAIGRFEVTFDDFDRFCTSSGRPCPPDGGNGRRDKPVIFVSWEDANAYAGWLSAQTGKTYRLPTEAEWEYAARGHNKDSRFWGKSEQPACRYANVADRSALQVFPKLTVLHQCDDQFPLTSPVGSFVPNPFGLYDMLGNVWEWCQDTYLPDYAKAAPDGRAMTGWDENRVRRGGSWFSIPRLVRSAARNGNPWSYRENDTGFRLVRELSSGEIASFALPADEAKPKGVQQ